MFEKVKGMHPQPQDVQGSFVIDDKVCQYFSEEATLLLIIGATDSQYKHCLLLRCVCTFASQKNGLTVRRDLSRLWASNCGLDVVRKGGSSGQAAASGMFAAFVEGGLFPRIGSSTKLFANGTTWTAVYIRPFDQSRSAASFQYGQPQVGGSFKLGASAFEAHECLRFLVLFKMLAPYILLQVDRFISPSAVENQIQQNIIGSRSCDTREEQVQRVMALNHFTYVQHPVGYHIDTFRDRIPILENKMCFMEESVGGKTGRGGAGKSKFVWAILDW